MPEDLLFPFDFDETGDAASVSGEDFYVQHAQLLGLIVAESIKGEGLTRADQIAFQTDLAESLGNSPYFSGPVSVTIVDSPQETFEAEIDVPETDTFEITV